MNWLESIGRNVITGLSNVGTAMLLIWQTIKQLKMLNIWHVLQQMAHLGVDSLPIISLTLLFAGGVMTLQITDVLITYGAQSTVGGLMAVAMGRELGPILVGVVLAGRVGAAITAEIGTMKVTEQIDALRVMAVSNRLPSGTPCCSLYDYGANPCLLRCCNWYCRGVFCSYSYKRVSPCYIFRFDTDFFNCF